MSDGIPLFIAEPAGTCRLSLRRFRHREDDAGHWHNASVVIDENAPETPRWPDGTHPASGHQIPDGDPRWPAACGCGEPFTGDDHRQVNELTWYEGGGRRFTWGVGSWEGPPGAMIRAPWRDDFDDNGMAAWLIFLPNGTYWCTRDRSTGDGTTRGPQWTVTGSPPLITVSPSIDDRSPSRPWHGWIRAGILEPA